MKAHFQQGNSPPSKNRQLKYIDMKDEDTDVEEVVQALHKGCLR